MTIILHNNSSNSKSEKWDTPWPAQLYVYVYVCEYVYVMYMSMSMSMSMYNVYTPTNARRITVTQKGIRKKGSKKRLFF